MSTALLRVVKSQPAADTVSFQPRVQPARRVDVIVSAIRSTIAFPVSFALLTTDDCPRLLFRSASLSVRRCNGRHYFHTSIRPRMCVDSEMALIDAIRQIVSVAAAAAAAVEGLVLLK